MIKIIKSILLSLAVVSVCMACSRDIDTVTLSDFNGSDLISSEDNVVLTPSLKNKLVLSLAWKNCVLSASTSGKGNVGVSSSQLTTTLQASSSSDFTTYTETSVTDNSKSYLGGDLNTLAKNAGLTAGTSAPLYFRIKASIGNNIDAKYSETAKVNITPYDIKMNTMQILNSAMTDTLAVLSSPTSNGVYAGFMPAAAWLNFYGQENDGTVWGNYGVTNYTFYLSKEDSKWNCWFPDVSGCYYVTMDTKNTVWTADLVKHVDVSGNATARMTYAMGSNTWKGVFTTTKDNATINLSAMKAHYNVTTGTDDSKVDSSTVYFAPNDTALTLSSSAGGITVSKAGTYTLTIKMSNNLTGPVFSIVAGSGGATSYSDELYMKTTDGSTWKTTLFSPTKSGVYNGFYNAAAWENFKFVTEDGNTYYGSVANSLYKLSSASDAWNIWFESAGYYLVNADLGNMAWSATAVTSVTATGDFNSWATSSDAFTYNATTNKWTATLNVSTVGWGLYFLVNGSWSMCLKASSDGVLGYNTGNNIVPSSTGTYLVTLDLSNFTYTMTKE